MGGLKCGYRLALVLVRARAGPLAKEFGFEGIVAECKDSFYESDK
jgi:hypothetical protein